MLTQSYAVYMTFITTYNCILISINLHGIENEIKEQKQEVMQTDYNTVPAITIPWYFSVSTYATMVCR